MQTKKLSQYKAIIFDVYGTLVDWETGIFVALQPLLEQSGVTWTRKDALEAFGSVETDLQAQYPEMLYSELLGKVYKAFADRLELQCTTEDERRFGCSIAAWPIFPDTVDALKELKKYFKLVVLSNVDNQSFNTFTRKSLEKNGPIFDLVITAQDIKSYKPDPANFQYALKMIQDQFDLSGDEVISVAQSLFHDHKPANALGLHSCWINRQGACMGLNSDATYDFQFDTLRDMANARTQE